MAESTSIEWADRTWSPWIGCQKVGPGCDHCFAEALNKRTGGSNWGPGAPRRRTSEAYWRQPAKWNAAGTSKVFPSLCDPFDNAVDRQWRRDFADVILATPNLTWLLLTKRIGNAAEMLADMFPDPGVQHNVWIGATIVNREELERDGPKLIATPARLRFWSYEPALGPLGTIPRELMPDWVIAGGESGPGARPMHPAWARSLWDQCATAGVPFLFKQWGEWHPSDQHETCEMKQVLAFRADGTTYRTADAAYWATRPGEQGMCRIGKARAGRLLDGVEHNGVPA